MNHEAPQAAPDRKQFEDKETQQVDRGSSTLETSAEAVRQREATAAEAAAQTALDEQKAQELAERIKNGDLAPVEQTLQAGREQYESDLAAKASRMNTMKGVLTGKRGEFSAEELMRSEAEDENRLRQSRGQAQAGFQAAAEKANKGKLMGRVSAEDVMVEEARKENEEQERSKKRNELIDKLLSGEVSLDTVSIVDSLKDICAVYGPSTLRDIFVKDMERNNQLDKSKLDMFRQVIGKDEHANGFYKEVLLKGLAKGWIDTMSFQGRLTGRFEEFNDDPSFVANAQRILKSRG